MRQWQQLPTPPGGQGLRPITLTTYGVGFEATVAAELQANLGVQVQIEALDFNGYSDQVENSNKPQIWTLSWIADYPHPHDFLGLLLQTGSTSNTGHAGDESIATCRRLSNARSSSVSSVTLPCQSPSASGGSSKRTS